ncbi:hypothetical protein ACFQ6Q_00095 [Streptomyces sp. NPDC056437]|uniref:hypothetical protein n=1 Tax=Streptomyces sp. NPDC056437 TaxID=3345816 RepID=UPI003695DFB6
MRHPRTGIDGATPTPEQELRAAAAKLRGLLADLDDCRGPWYIANEEQRPYPQSIRNQGVPYLVADTYTDPVAPPETAQYICAMHPGVGLALADWLESTARTVEAVAEKYEPDPGAHWLAPALAVARQILGAAS